MPSQAAGSACGSLGTNAAPLLPKLMALAERDGPARGNVLGSLLQVAPGDVRVLPLLIRGLDDASPGMRGNAAAVLRTFGPEAHAAVPGLQKLLMDHEPWVRFNAALALWNIARQPPSIPVFVEALKVDDETYFVPRAVCKLFGEMGPAAKEGAPALRELISHWDPNVRALARGALEKVDPADPALRERRVGVVSLPPPAVITSLPPREDAIAVPKIPIALGASIRKLRSNDRQVRFEALEELGRKGPNAREAVPFLKPLIKTEDAETRSYIAAMLADVDPTGAQSLPILVDALGDREAEVRAAALLSVRKLGPHGRSAMDSVRLALKDPDESVRRAASDALNRINVGVTNQ